MKEEYDFSKMKGKENPYAKRVKKDASVRTRKKIPLFEDEDQEREFWSKNSPLDFIDDDSVTQGDFPNLKPTPKSVSD